MKDRFYRVATVLMLSGVLSVNADGGFFDNVKNINFGMSEAAVELDKECQNPVEPFNLSDNVASLGLLAAKAKGAGLVGSFFGKKDETSTLDIVKDGAKQLHWLPMSIEVALADSRHQNRSDILPPERFKKEYGAANTILQTLLAQIKEPHEYDFKIFIVRGSGKAAVASPGGYIYITRGILKDREYATYAIAHEISHSLKRHETMALQSMLIDSVETADEILSLVKSPEENANKMLGKLAVTKLLFMKFHEDQELTADSCAIRFVRDAYPTQSHAIVSAFLESLPDTQITNEKQDIVDLFQASIAKHPSSKVRKEHLIKLVKQKPKQHMSHNDAGQARF